MTPTCRSCDATILWAEHHGTGRRMPLDDADVGSDARGAFVVLDGKAYVMGNAVPYLSERDAVSMVTAANRLKDHYEWHVSHFSTCPNSATHRR